MAEPDTFSFKPEGWLDTNVVRFWEESNEGFVKLFAQELDEPQIELTFYPEGLGNGIDRGYRLYRDKHGDADLISVLVSVPEQRYWLIHEMLVRNQDNLQRINVTVTYETTDENSDEGEVIEVQFDTTVGEYFSRPPTLGRRRS